MRSKTQKIYENVTIFHSKIENFLLSFKCNQSLYTSFHDLHGNKCQHKQSINDLELTKNTFKDYTQVFIILSSFYLPLSPSTLYSKNPTPCQLTQPKNVYKNRACLLLAIIYKMKDAVALKSKVLSFQNCLARRGTGQFSLHCKRLVSQTMFACQKKISLRQFSDTNP